MASLAASRVSGRSQVAFAGKGFGEGAAHLRAAAVTGARWSISQGMCAVNSENTSIDERDTFSRVSDSSLVTSLR
jgi:hypothetical protein